MTPLEEVAANQEERIESNIIDMKEAFYDREPDLKIVSDSQSQINKKPLYYRFIKRAFDVVFSLIVIVITFIPMLILSVFVAIDTKAFPIYSQERVGHKGPFKFFKMRSMVRDSDDLKKYFTPEQIEQWNKEHKVDSDPRIDSRIIETNAMRPLSALAFASVFPPKTTGLPAVFPQVDVQISNLRNLLEKSSRNFFANADANPSLSKKLAICPFAQIAGSSRLGSNCAATALLAA